MRLVHHDARVGQAAPVAQLSGSQQQRRHGRRLAHADGGHRAADVLHGVVDGQARGYDAACNALKTKKLRRVVCCRLSMREAIALHSVVEGQTRYQAAACMEVTGALYYV